MVFQLLYRHIFGKFCCKIRLLECLEDMQPHFTLKPAKNMPDQGGKLNIMDGAIFLGNS